MEKPKRRFGDRRDGRWVREAPGLQTVMAHLMPNRTDCEVCLHDTLDATELMKFIEEKTPGIQNIRLRSSTAFYSAWPG